MWIWNWSMKPILFSFKFLTSQVGLYGLVNMEPESNRKPKLFILRNLHPTDLGILIHPWAFGLNGWFGSYGLLDSPMMDTKHIWPRVRSLLQYLFFWKPISRCLPLDLLRLGLVLGQRPILQKWHHLIHPTWIDMYVAYPDQNLIITLDVFRSLMMRWPRLLMNRHGSSYF